MNRSCRHTILALSAGKNQPGPAGRATGIHAGPDFPGCAIPRIAAASICHAAASGLHDRSLYALMVT